MTKSIQHTFFYSQKPEVVWEYLTKAELIEQWLMKNDFKPIAGHTFQFTTNPLPDFDSDGIFYCKVLEIIPFKKLSYSWRGGPGDGNISLDTVVEWTLIEKDKGTQLNLEQSGFRQLENANIFSAMDAGWLSNIRKIATLINVSKHDTNNA